MDKIKPKKKMAMGKMMGGGMSKKPMAYKKGGMSKEQPKPSQGALQRLGKAGKGKMSPRDIARTRKNKK